MTSVTDTPFIKDGDVHAYADGELAPEAVPAMEARIAADVGTRVLLTALGVQRDALLSHFPLPDECPKTKALMERVLASTVR